MMALLEIPAPGKDFFFFLGGFIPKFLSIFRVSGSAHILAAFMLRLEMAWHARPPCKKTPVPPTYETNANSLFISFPATAE